MNIEQLEADYKAKKQRTSELLDKYIALRDEWLPKMEEAGRLHCDALEEQGAAFSRWNAAKIREQIQKEIGAESK